MDGSDTGDKQMEMGHFRLGSTFISGETGLSPSLSSWGMVGIIGRCNISVISWSYHSMHCVAPLAKSSYVLPVSAAVNKGERTYFVFLLLYYTPFASDSQRRTTKIADLKIFTEPFTVIRQYTLLFYTVSSPTYFCSVQNVM